MVDRRALSESIRNAYCIPPPVRRYWCEVGGRSCNFFSRQDWARFQHDLRILANYLASHH